MPKQSTGGLSPTPDRPTDTLPPQPTPQTPQQNYVTDPYGSGATFSGNPNSPHYQQDLERWLMQREQAYKQSPQYQADQRRDNPDVASGKIPAVGFTAEGPNAWGVPVGATVTSLDKSESGYLVSYRERGTPQEVTIAGAGYSMSGTVYAASQQEAARRMLGTSKVQYQGVDVSPRQLGSKIFITGSKNAEVIVGDPELNDYWLKMGLPQYAGYDIPKLSSSQEAVGFYVKKVEADGLAPSVSIGNKQWESFWNEQGFPEYGDYQPVALGRDEYIKKATPTEQGLSFQLGNRSYEKTWRELGYPEYGDYEPPTLGQDDYLKEVARTEQGLTYTVGNRKVEAEQARLEVRLGELNRELDVINRQNEVFTSSVNKGDITVEDYRNAMKAQTQNTLKLLGEAETLGFISAEEKVTQSKQLSSFMGSIDSFALNVGKYNKLTSTIEAENTVFASKLKAGDITQDDYVKAMGFQTQRTINAINQAAKDDLFTPEAAKAATVATAINFQSFLNEVKLNKYTPVIATSNVDNALKMSGIKQQATLTANIRQGTKAEGITEAKILGTLTPTEQKEYLRIKTEKAIYAGVTSGVFVVAGATIPLSLPTSLTLTGVKVIATEAALGAGLSVGINQAVKSVSGGGVLTLQEAAISAGEGLLFLGANKLALNAVRVVVPRVAASTVGRVGVATGVGITGEYVTTGKVTPENIALAGGMALGFEGIGRGASKLYNPVKAGIKAKLGLSDSTVKVFTETTRAQQKNLVSRSFNYGDDMGDLAEGFYKVDGSMLRNYEGRYGSIARASDTGVLGGSNVGKTQVKAKTPSLADEEMLNLLRPDLAEERSALYWEQRLGKVTEIKDTVKGSNANKNINLERIRQNAESKEFQRLTRPDLAEQKEAIELSNLFSPKQPKPVRGSNQSKDPLKVDDLSELAKQRMINKGVPEEFINKAQRVNIEAAWGEPGVKGLKLYDKPEDGFTAMMKRLKGLSVEEQAKAQMRELNLPEEFIEKSRRVNIESAWGEGGSKGLLRYPDERQERSIIDLIKSLRGKKEPDIIQPTDPLTGGPKKVEDYIQKSNKRATKSFDTTTGAKTVESASGGQQLIMLEKPQQITKTKAAQKQQNNAASLIELEKTTVKTKKATRQTTALASLVETEKADTTMLTAPPSRITIEPFPAIAVTPEAKIQVKSDTVLSRAQVFKTEIKTAFTPKVTVTPKIKQTPSITNIQTQKVAPIVSTKFKPVQIPKAAQNLKFKTQPAQTVASKLRFDTDQALKYKQTISFKTNSLTAQGIKPKFPPPLSNDNIFKDKTPKNLNSKWYVKRHKVKTSQQMLKTFGFNSAPKNIFGKLEKPINRLDKSVDKMFTKRSRR